MPGENILVIDDSLAVQDIARMALSGSGYQVTTASNGAAALTYPCIEDVNLIVIDSDLEGLSGEQTTTILKQHGHTHPIPVVLLVPEEKMSSRESLALSGACGYLLKPFDGPALVRKVEQALEQQNMDDLARQYLADTADKLMKGLAEQQIGAAVERKTQIIVERCIQNVISLVDQRARGEVEQRVTGLIGEKEQELVKMTVREVAQSMVEKLAERKVEEAMQTILAEQTDRAVKRVADQTLPNIIRDKIKEMLANIVPREVETKLQKAAEKMVPEISQQIIGTVESVANKTIPRAGRELLPPVVEAQVRGALEKELPRKVAELVARELRDQLSTNIEPVIRESVARIRKSVLIINGLMAAAVFVGVAAMLYMRFFGTK